MSRLLLCEQPVWNTPHTHTHTLNTLTFPENPHPPKFGGVEIHPPNLGGESSKATCFNLFSGAHSLNLGGEGVKSSPPKFGGYGFSGFLHKNWPISRVLFFFFPFCPLWWPPLFLPFSRHLFALFSASKSALAQHRAWRGAVWGLTSPQNSGRKFLPEICVKKSRFSTPCDLEDRNLLKQGG